MHPYGLPNMLTKSVSSYYFIKSVDHFLQKPEDVKNAKPIPDTLQAHKSIRHMDKSCFAITFFGLCSKEDHYQTQWYCIICSHKVNHRVDINACNFYFQNYDKKENCE